MWRTTAFSGFEVDPPRNQIWKPTIRGSFPRGLVYLYNRISSAPSVFWFSASSFTSTCTRLGENCVFAHTIREFLWGHDAFDHWTIGIKGYRMFGQTVPSWLSILSPMTPYKYRWAWRIPIPTAPNAVRSMVHCRASFSKSIQILSPNKKLHYKYPAKS